MAGGELVELSPVAVGGATAGAIALFGRLAHAALGLARQPIALELVPELLHADHQAALGGVGITAAGRVVDRDADLSQLALEQASSARVRRRNTRRQTSRLCTSYSASSRFILSGLGSPVVESSV